MALGLRGCSHMISKNEKIFIINEYLKDLNCQKYTLNNKISQDSSLEDIAEINFSILSIDEKIQAIEYEKININ
jgi:hypothetical protein